MDLKNYLTSSNTRKADFARTIGVSPALLHQWMESIRPVAPQHCPRIEMETSGAVSRRELRPDDWHLIWPELVASTTVATPVSLAPINHNGENA